MKDDEIIETFLEENAREIRRAETRKKIVRNAKLMLTYCAAFCGIVCFCVFSAMKIHSCEVAYEKEDADQARIEADHAYIVVKYGPDGHVANCWVLKDKNAIAIEGGWGSSFVNMNHWRDYKWFAKQLGADPGKCEVWDWAGKQ
jgi:hypothetical protein